MKNYIKINGVNSNTITGLMINELPPISKPEMRTLTEEIDGRDGDIITDLGYSSYDKTITIGLFGNGYDINDIIAFFNGEGTIVFSNEDDKYYNFKIINKIDYERLQKFKTASITFHCQPFKYPLEETPLEIEYEFVNGEGESITLNDTENGTPLDISLKGNTSQYTTTGKNLLNARQNSFTYQTSSTTLTENIGTVNMIAGTTYYISYTQNKTLTSDTRNTPIIKHNGSRTYQNSNENANLTAGRKVWEYTPNETGDYTFEYWCHTPSQEVIISDFMISTNSDTTYEPYTNGASPNPSYPQPINVVSGDNTIEVCNRNLWDEEWEVGFIDTDGSINSAYTQRRTTTYIPVKPNTTYYEASPNSAYGGRIAYYSKDKNLVLFSNSGISQSDKTFTTPDDCYFVRITFGSSYGTTYNNDICINISDSQNGTYTKHEGTSYPIYLGVENLINYDGTQITLIKSTNRTQTVYFSNDTTLQAGTYTLSLTDLSTSNLTQPIYFRLRLDGDLDTTNYEITNKQATFTLNSSKTLNGIYIFLSSDDVSNATATFSEIVVEKGSKANHPSNTQLELCKIGDYQDYFTKNSGKNLVEATLEHSNLDASGTIIGDSYAVYDLHIAKVVQGATYTMSVGLSASDDRVFGFFTNYPTLNASTYDNSRVIQKSDTFTSPITGYVTFRSATSYQFAMLNTGTTPLPYEPYGTGQWCKYNAIGKVVLDGSENWQTTTATHDNFTRFNLSSPPIASYNKALCDKFTIGETTSTTTTNLLEYRDTSVIYVNTDVAQTSNAFKTWLSNNNTIVYYALATPYLSLIEDTTLINQLDNIQNAMSYEGQTNIGQVNNDKAFIITATAMKEGTNEVEVENIGNIYARPTLDIKGNGTINVYKDNTQLLQLDMSETNEIVIEDMEAYNPSTNELMNRKVIGDYSKITCPSGTCIYKVDGDLTKMTITNYVRWL